MEEQNVFSPPGSLNGEEMQLGQPAAPKTDIELMKWENELLRRENALLIKEKQLSAVNSLNGGMGTVKMGLHEIKTLIREFNPSQDSLTAKDWIESINGLKTLYHWDDQSTLFYASLRLGGAAYHWYQGKQHSLATFEEFRTELLRSFPTGQDDASVLIKIMQRKRSPGEAIESYIYEVTALGRTISLTEETIIRYIISGLNNQNLENVVTASNCGSIPQMLKIITNFEEIKKQEQERRNFRLNSETGPPKDNGKFQPFYKDRKITKGGKNRYSRVENNVLRKGTNGKQRGDEKMLWSVLSVTKQDTMQEIVEFKMCKNA